MVVAGEIVQSIKAVGLQYANIDKPGCTRKRNGKGFVYIDIQGKNIRNKLLRKRIESLAIPPAWKNVWICPNESGHIQAVGYDDKGRKQYLYHPRWREMREETKFECLLEFSNYLPLIRKRVQDDLRKKELSREKVLACAVKMLDTTLLRIGSERYRSENGSYGLTTIRCRHIRKIDGQLHICFQGKAGVKQDVTIDDPQLVKIIRSLEDLPGQDLLQYIDEEGQARDVKSNDVNDYIKEIAGHDFSAKIFRTWGGTVAALRRLSEQEHTDSITKNKKIYNSAVCETAGKLGNTTTVCKKHYIHPILFEAFMDERLQAATAKAKKNPHPHRLTLEERALRHLLMEQVVEKQKKKTRRVGNRKPMGTMAIAAG